MIIVYCLILVLTFYLLSFISDNFFVKSLEKISERLNLSSEVTGATFMAIGSSAPELFTSIFAVFAIFWTWGNENIGSGTIVGSAIFNILVIIGLSLLFTEKNKKLHRQPIVRDLCFYTLTIWVLILSFWDWKVSFWESGIFLALYCIYIYVVSQWSKRLHYNVDSIPLEEEQREEKQWEKRLSKVLWFIIPHPEKHYRWAFIVSIIIIWILSHEMVNAAVSISYILHIPKTVIGLTILAAWTSVPDAISSIIVAKKWKISMSFTNALGSNIFDILFWLWAVYFVYFLIYGIDNSITVDNHNLFSSIFLLFATVALILVVLTFKKRKTNKNVGLLLLAVYIVYLCYMIYTIV